MSERNREIRFFSKETDPKKRDIGRAVSERAYFRPIPGLEELEKTEFEQRVIAVLENRYQEFFQEIGIVRDQIPESQIHIVTPSFYEACRLGGRAITILQHVYMQREVATRDLPVRILSHELAHAHGKMRVDIQHQMRLLGDGEAHDIQIGRSQSGVSFRSPHDGRGKKRFEGLNEALVDLISMDVRTDKAVVEGLQLTEEEQKKLHIYGYPDPVVLAGILKEIEPDAEKRKQLRMALQKDALEGSYNTLKALGRQRKDLVKNLAILDGTPESAIRVARLFGLERVVRHLEQQHGI